MAKSAAERKQSHTENIIQCLCLCVKERKNKVPSSFPTDRSGSRSQRRNSLQRRRNGEKGEKERECSPEVLCVFPAPPPQNERTEPDYSVRFQADG